MRALDRLLRRWRAGTALPFTERGDRLLDIGCFDGWFLRFVERRLAFGAGIDPLASGGGTSRVLVVRGAAPPLPFRSKSFDCITLLAVLEHVEDADALVHECARVLSDDGRVIVTVPSPAVDIVLTALRFLRLVEGMSLHEHHGYDPSHTPEIFGRAGFSLLVRRRFQLGLNHLFVFQKGQGER